MAGPSEDESQLVLTTLENLSLDETRDIERNFCLTPSPTSSPTLSEFEAADDTPKEGTDELEWIITTLPERLAAEEIYISKPPIPDDEDPNYDELMETALLYHQWWECPGVDMNEGNNRARFRSAYHRLAFSAHTYPFALEGMTTSEMISCMYEWDERLRQNTTNSLKLAEYSIKDQALLKQPPPSISISTSDDDKNFDYIFKSKGRIQKVHTLTDFCQGKLHSYDGRNREVREQARIVKKLNKYKSYRKYLQDTNEYVYRESKRFHDGSIKGSNWMNMQEPDEKLGDSDAYRANAVTHLRLQRLRNPLFVPEWDAPVPVDMSLVAAADVYPERKYAKLRRPSPRVIPQGTQAALISLFYNGPPIVEKTGARNRPTARVRRRTDLHGKCNPTKLYPSPCTTISTTITTGKSKQSKRARRQLLHSQHAKTRTEKLVELETLRLGEEGLVGWRGPVDEMSMMHWVLDDEGRFRDWRYFEAEWFEESEWREIPGELVGVVGVRGVEGGRRFSTD